MLAVYPIFTLLVALAAASPVQLNERAVAAPLEDRSFGQGCGKACWRRRSEIVDQALQARDGGSNVDILGLTKDRDLLKKLAEALGNLPLPYAEVPVAGDRGKRADLHPRFGLLAKLKELLAGEKGKAGDCSKGGLCVRGVQAPEEPADVDEAELGRLLDAVFAESESESGPAERGLERRFGLLAKLKELLAGKKDDKLDDKFVGFAKRAAAAPGSPEAAGEDELARILDEVFAQIDDSGAANGAQQ